MAYFDVYKKKLGLRGGSVGNSLKSNGENFIIGNFKDDPTYKDGKLISKETFTETQLDIRVENVDASANEKKIVVLPNAKVGNGDYILYDDKTFLVEEIEDNVIAPVLKCVKCNQVLRWKGIEKDVPCYITNDAYGSKILTDNSFLSNTDTKAKILVQDNMLTRQIKKDFRFIFGSSEFDIFKVIDITRSMTDGIITLITKKDKLMNEDDLENNIAFNEEFVSEKYIIKGSDNIKINNSYIYETDAVVSKCEVDEKDIAGVSNTTRNSCEVVAFAQDEYFILYGKDSKGNILCSKAISTTR